MESLYFLIPLTLIVVVIALKLLFWAIQNGQYDDLNTEGQRILFDDNVTRDNHPQKNLPTTESASANKDTSS